MQKAIRVRIYWLGQLPYSTAADLQTDIANSRIAGTADDVLLLLTHPPTITMGRRAAAEHVLASPVELALRGITVHRSNRGGDVTYHGPNQLIGYPIINLTCRGSDVHAYLRALEQVLIDALAVWNISAGRRPPLTGVWIGDRKVAAIGVAIRRWVTTHGFALNVAPDLSGFSLIVPCGIRDFGVTSVSQETHRAVGIVEAIQPVAEAFMRRFPRCGDAATSVAGLAAPSLKILSAGIDLTANGVLDCRAVGR